jgi:phosphotransferase system HPr-like phosphotransfer protein
MTVTYRRQTVDLTPGQALVDTMAELTKRVIPRLPALLSGQRVDQSDLSAVLRTRAGHGLLVSVSVTPLDAEQVAQLVTQNIAEGQA